MYITKRGLIIFIGVGIPLAIYGGVTLAMRMRDVNDGTASNTDPRDIVAARVRSALGFK